MHSILQIYNPLQLELIRVGKRRARFQAWDDKGLDWVLAVEIQRMLIKNYLNRKDTSGSM